MEFDDLCEFLRPRLKLCEHRGFFRFLGKDRMATDDTSFFHFAIGRDLNFNANIPGEFELLGKR